MAYLGAVASTLFLAGCDLTNSEAERILNSEARGNACVTDLKFTEDGFKKARSDRVVISMPPRIGEAMDRYRLADTIDGQLHDTFGEDSTVSRKQNNSCLPGKAEVTSITDDPLLGSFAPGRYKTVNFTEVVDIPPELKRMEPYVYVRYKKSARFQKTDNGWKVM